MFLKASKTVASVILSVINFSPTFHLVWIIHLNFFLALKSNITFDTNKYKYNKYNLVYIGRYERKMYLLM